MSAVCPAWSAENVNEEIECKIGVCLSSVKRLQVDNTKNLFNAIILIIS